MEMNDVRGTVNVYLYGPTEQLANALAKLEAHGIPASKELNRRGPDGEALVAFFHDGTVRPSPEFVQRCKERAGAAADGTGFTVDEAGVEQGNAATRQMLHNRITGQWLGWIDAEEPLQIREERLEELAHVYGITVNEIELRDPDYLTPPTE